VYMPYVESLSTKEFMRQFETTFLNADRLGIALPITFNLVTIPLFRVYLRTLLQVIVNMWFARLLVALFIRL
jgi:hypothetical protein